MSQLGEEEELRTAERAALVDHLDEHLAALTAAEDALLEGLAPHAEAFVAALGEAEALAATAARLATATRPGTMPRMPRLDVLRLVQAVLGGDRLVDTTPAAPDDFYATLQTAMVEG